jgi:hypothetical protein
MEPISISFTYSFIYKELLRILDVTCKIMLILVHILLLYWTIAYILGLATLYWICDM